MTEQGLGSLGASLAARVLTLAPEFYVTNAPVALGESLGVRVPPDTEPDERYVFFLINTGGGYFPYGRSVLPDVPL